MIKDRGIADLLGAYHVAVELFSNKHELGFFKIDRILIARGRQACFLDLVDVAAAVFSAKCQGFFIIGRKEGGGKGIPCLAKLVGVSLRTDEAVENRLSPQNANTAPRSRHGIKAAVGLCRGQEHPIVTDQRKGIFKNVFRGFFKKHRCILLPVFAMFMRLSLGIFSISHFFEKIKGAA